MTGCSGKGKEPDRTSDYLKPDYWDSRFEQEQDYEWFKDYSAFKHLVQPHLIPQANILILGCGNSAMTLDLWRDGHKNVTSIDLSQVVIDKMRARAEAEGMHGLKWQAADILSLPFETASFDAVIEKGTMDVLFVDNDSPWNPNADVVKRVHVMLGETHRVLKPDGIFISVTFAQPHFRRPFFTAASYDWGFQHRTFGEGFHYFVYALHRGKKEEGRDECETYDPSKFASHEGIVHQHMDSEDYLMQIDL